MVGSKAYRIKIAITHKNQKKILFITGTRADFGKLKPLIRAVESTSGFEANIFATGMHMLSRYGSTVHEIHKSGFKRVYSYINQDGAVTSRMDLVLANTIHGLAHYLLEFPVELIVVHGDRVEALAGAITGALNNILVAHIEGGEISGTVDELIRHSVSKLSHIHFVSNVEAFNRLVQMGELEKSIFVIGSPEIDIMLSDELPSLPEVKRKYEIEFSEYAIFMYHPVTTELANLRTNIEIVLDALKASGINYVVLYPNNDTGSEIIMESLSGLNVSPNFRIIPSIRFEYFLTLMKNAKAVVGNSSAGIREAPVFGVPTINIGNRQYNRFNHSSISNVPENKQAILDALTALPESVAPSMYFGNGKSSKLFISHLCEPKFWTLCYQKQFRDLNLLLGR